jgi:hypothetical protein
MASLLHAQGSIPKEHLLGLCNGNGDVASPERLMGCSIGVGALDPPHG